MKSLIKKLIPSKLLSQYHKYLAILANLFYGKPSDKLIVIGVTGTGGKSTTIELINGILETAGYKTGLTSTIRFKVDKQTCLNNKKMTMLGRFQTQKIIKQMVQADCDYAIIETSSQGIEQFRHWGINYDILVFTNLWTEHIEAHGSFANYREAKGKLFDRLSELTHKKINERLISKISVVNLDDKEAGYFLQFNADHKFGYTRKTKYDITGIEEVRAENIKINKQGLQFSVLGQEFLSELLGQFNIDNILSAITIGLSQGIDLTKIATGIASVRNIPGHLEFIPNKKDLKIIVDYAFEPVALTKMYETLRLHQLIQSANKIIHVLGSAGGGRDKVRRPKLGAIAGQNADRVIITNEDPYDENPQDIIDQVAQGAEQVGKTNGQNLFKILDRRVAIKKALELTQPGDLVIITGKGCEQSIVGPNNQKIPWDDREVVREELDT